MAAIDFPPGVTNGQQFTAPNGLVYVWSTTPSPGLWIAQATTTGSQGIVKLYSEVVWASGTQMLPAIPPGAKMIDLEFVLQLGVSNRNVALACYKNGAPHAVASAHHAQNTQSKGATVSGIAPLPATFWTLIGGVTSCYGHCRFSWKAGDDIVYGNGHIFGNDNAGVPVDVTSSMYCSGLAGGSLTGIGVAADDGLVLTSGSYARIYSVW